VCSTQHAEKRQERVKKKSKGGNDRGFFFPPQLFGKKFFGGVFELPLLRNAQKRHKP
jgi:hypothetical protein